eukprot:EG_transcript_22675
MCGSGSKLQQAHCGGDYTGARQRLSHSYRAKVTEASSAAYSTRPSQGRLAQVNGPLCTVKGLLWVRWNRASLRRKDSFAISQQHGCEKPRVCWVFDVFPSFRPVLDLFRGQPEGPPPQHLCTPAPTNKKADHPGSWGF